MPKDLLTPQYPAQLVEQVTGISLVTQRNWIAREMYGLNELAPYLGLNETIAGKSRLWPRIGVYENEGMADLKEHGQDPLLFSRAMYKRINEVGLPVLIAKKGSGSPTGSFAVAYFETELLEEGVKRMPEFGDNDPADPYFWFVRYNKDRWPTQLDCIKQSEVGGHMSKPDDGGFSQMVFKITALVAKVDGKLAAAAE